MFVKSLRDLRLASVHGYCLHLNANEVTEIPDKMAREAFEQGCVAVEAPTQDAVPPPEEPSVRSARVKAAIEELVAKGDRHSFKNDGTPKVTAVSAAMNETVSAVEIEAAWAEISKVEE